MLANKADDFIDTVLSYVNYSFDRKKIRLELESHITDKIQAYLHMGNTEQEAVNKAIHDMGDARETGEALNKMHKPILGWLLKKSKVFAMIAVLIIFSRILFTVGANFARDQEIKRDASIYISNMYWEINSTTNLLKHVEDWGASVDSSDHSINPFSQLLFRLNEMKSLSQTAVLYIGYSEDLSSISNITNSFDIIYQSIGGGVTYNSQLICYDFMKDGVLSEKEIKFLVTFREDLADIQEGLNDKEIYKHNFDIPLEEFAEMINPFVNKYNFSNLTGIGLSN